MSKQKIYAIGSTIEIAPMPWVLKMFNPNTVSCKQKEITKKLLTPAIKSKMNFYSDLDGALNEAVKGAKDYGKRGVYNDFPPVFLVEVEYQHNKEFEVIKILEGYVIPKEDGKVIKCEMNLEQALKNKDGSSSIFSYSINTDSKIICNKNNYYGNFSELLQQGKRVLQAEYKELQAKNLLSFLNNNINYIDQKYLEELHCPRNSPK